MGMADANILAGIDKPMSLVDTQEGSLLFSLLMLHCGGLVGGEKKLLSKFYVTCRNLPVK